MIERSTFSEKIKNATKLWVDPPNGWMYNFPAIWDREKETLEIMLKRHNYPEKDIEFALQYMRMWLIDENNK